jgi:hypothetical protein
VPVDQSEGACQSVEQQGLARAGMADEQERVARGQGREDDRLDGVEALDAEAAEEARGCGGVCVSHMCAGFDGCVLSSSGSGQQQAAIHMWSGADAKKRVAPTVPTVQHHALGNEGGMEFLPEPFWHSCPHPVRPPWRSALGWHPLGGIRDAALKLYRCSQTAKWQM